MIIEELFEFQRNVLSKESDKEVKYKKLGEFLYDKGFKSAASQQLLIDCLDSTDKESLYFPIAMFLAIIFALLMILTHTSEISHPVLFTVSTGVIVVLLVAILLMVKQIISNERKKISNMIRWKVMDGRSFVSEN